MIFFTDSNLLDWSRTTKINLSGNLQFFCVKPYALLVEDIKTTEKALLCED